VPESNDGTMDAAERLPEPVVAFVERALVLDDDDRAALAAARSALDEAFHLGAWRSANEIVGRAPRLYIEIRHRLAGVFLPRHLGDLVELGPEADPDEVAQWVGVARLARMAVDDALMGLLAAHSIRPPDLRELLAPWKAMLTAAHRRERAPG
ncbi:MAG TPA: hypothetical protein VE962_07800, partial [Actinomycetota bacterium]|nr:hypothetical protein [Actinomycetota bacterium]